MSPTISTFDIRSCRSSIHLNTQVLNMSLISVKHQGLNSLFIWSNIFPHFLSSQNAQRLAGAQVAQALTTPVVSVTTPSLLAQGLPFSAMPTAYNTGYLKHEQIATNAYTLNKNINATCKVLVPCFMSWNKRSQKSMCTKSFFISNLVHKIVHIPDILFPFELCCASKWLNVVTFWPLFPLFCIHYLVWSGRELGWAVYVWFSMIWGFLCFGLVWFSIRGRCH